MTLPMDFSVDRPGKLITIKRPFNAELPLVWAAFTKSEILDQWWAPKPWRAKTKSMDFRPGGHWHYAMLGPEGEESWSLGRYQTIQPQEGFTQIVNFSDADGDLDNNMPTSNWAVDFSPLDTGSLVVFQITFDDLAQLDTLIKMGFSGGMAMIMKQLDELLASNPEHWTTTASEL